MFTRTSISRLRQNDHERAMGMVQAGITHQAVTDHFNVSRITISRLMIRLRQICKTNDRPRYDRLCVKSQRQDRHLRLIHPRNGMITAEDTACRRPGLANVRMSSQTVRRRLRESRLRPRCPVVVPILKQHLRTARLSLTRARRRWKLHTWQHILFNDKSRISLRFSDGCYRVSHRRGERFTDQCGYESDRVRGGIVMVWAGICCDGRTQLKIVQGTLNAIKTILLIQSFCPFCNSETLIMSFNHDNARCHVACVCQDFLNQNHIRVIPLPALSTELLPIELGRRVHNRQIHWKHYRSCATHVWTSGTTSHKPVFNVDWLYASEMRSCRCCKR
jgi:hypothetical protein